MLAPALLLLLLLGRLCRAIPTQTGNLNSNAELPYKVPGRHLPHAPPNVSLPAVPRSKRESTSPETETDFRLENPGLNLFEGDLKLKRRFIKRHYLRTDDDQTRKRRGVAKGLRFWPNAVVPYFFSSEVPSNTRAVVLKAMLWISSETCIQFVPRKSEREYLKIQSSSPGCFANMIGSLKNRWVYINLQPGGCSFTGIAAHELLHILGMWHEQSRADRDLHININYENIKVQANQFSKRNTDSLGFEYDFNSIMHYPLNAFAKQGTNSIAVKNTDLLARQEARRDWGGKIGQRLRLSDIDLGQLRAMYTCPTPTTTTTTTTSTTTTTTTTTTNHDLEFPVTTTTTTRSVLFPNETQHTTQQTHRIFPHDTNHAEPCLLNYVFVE
eukprot:m.151057 g.151057  ORF g.151057 m.151057 type:complete len:384 (-) comp24492_c1_seq1:701-1852(-)